MNEKDIGKQQKINPSEKVGQASNRNNSASSNGYGKVPNRSMAGGRIPNPNQQARKNTAGLDNLSGGGIRPKRFGIGGSFGNNNPGDTSTGGSENSSSNTSNPSSVGADTTNKDDVDSSSDENSSAETANSKTSSNEVDIFKGKGKKALKLLVIKIVLSIVSVFLFFLLFICVLISPLIALGIIDGEDIGNFISGGSDGSSSSGYSSSFVSTTNTDYWWPIGSSKTINVNGVLFAPGEPSSKSITATFAGDDSTHNGAHGAIDIGADVNTENIIATKDGKVIYPTASDYISYNDGYYGCRDGGGYGNYVMIDHGNGMVSLYGHMYKDTITVRSGDVVKQGQIIGKSGTSGSSTGGHLHFELRLNGERVDPLEYVSPDNPRPGIKTNNNNSNDNTSGNADTNSEKEMEE